MTFGIVCRQEGGLCTISPQCHGKNTHRADAIQCDSIRCGVVALWLLALFCNCKDLWLLWYRVIWSHDHYGFIAAAKLPLMTLRTGSQYFLLCLWQLLRVRFSAKVSSTNAAMLGSNTNSLSWSKRHVKKTGGTYKAGTTASQCRYSIFGAGNNMFPCVSFVFLDLLNLLGTSWHTNGVKSTLETACSASMIQSIGNVQQVTCKWNIITWIGGICVPRICASTPNIHFGLILSVGWFRIITRKWFHPTSIEKSDCSGFQVKIYQPQASVAIHGKISFYILQSVSDLWTCNCKWQNSPSASKPMGIAFSILQNPSLHMLRGGSNSLEV